MRAFINPLLLVACMLLLVFGAASPEGDNGWGVAGWVLLLCVMAVIVNGTLGLARALTQRPSLMSIGWAVLFLLFGCTVWLLISGGEEGSIASQERTALRRRVEAWKDGRMSPCRADENGDTLFTLAAGLGRVDILRDPALYAGQVPAEALSRAAFRAAERNREEALRLLLGDPHSVPAAATVDGQTLLHAAAMNRARRAAACLLELAAPVNAVDAEGATPLHYAVIAGDAAMVALLVQHGADPTVLDKDGRDAASYARSEAVQAALCPPPAAP